MSKPKQARVASSLLPFDVVTERTDPTVTSFAGLPLAIEAWHALGLDAACRDHVKLKESQRGLPEAGWIELLVMLRVAGGRTPADLAALKEDAGLLRLWSLPEQVTPRAAYQFLDRFHDSSRPPAIQGKAVAIRVPSQREIAFDQESESLGWKRFAICTNRWKLDAEDLIWWHRERCGSVEKLHDILKNEEGCASLPSQHFGANAAWYRIGVLAFNLHQAMGILCLPDEFRGQRPSTLRFRLLRLAGRVVCHAGKHALILSSTAASLASVYVAARAALAALVSG